MTVWVCAIHCVVLLLVFGKCGDVTDGGLRVRDPLCRALTCVWEVWWRYWWRSVCARSTGSCFPPSARPLSAPRSSPAATTCLMSRTILSTGNVSLLCIINIKIIYQLTRHAARQALKHTRVMLARRCKRFLKSTLSIPHIAKTAKDTNNRNNSVISVTSGK